MKKTVINTDLHGYRSRQDLRNRKLSVFEDLGKEFHSLTNETPKDSLLRMDAWGLLKTTILANFSSGPKQLSFEKTCELYELNTSKFKELSKIYNSIKLDETKPIEIEDYQTYAANEKQIECYNEVSEAIEKLDLLKTKYNLFSNLERLCVGLHPLVQYQLGGKPVPNVQYLKKLT